MAFSSDSRFLATLGDDGYARVWRLADGSEVARIPGRTLPNRGSLYYERAHYERAGLAFAGGNRYLYVDHALFYWKTDDVIQQACRLFAPETIPAEYAGVCERK